MPSPPGRYRRLLALGILAALGAAAVLAWQLVKKPTLGDLVKDGEAEYERGAAALAAKDGPGAVAAFDRALGKADGLLGKLDEIQRTAKLKPDDERALELNRGAAYWLKARSLRDREYGKAVADGRPLSEPLDTTTRQRYRTFLEIPDEAMKIAALTALEEALVRVATHPDIVREALRVRLSLDPPRWALISQLAQATLVQSPDDTRAHYLLARIDFEQFDDQNLPTPPDRRDPDRVLKAAKALAASKKSGDYPVWRTLDLDVRITRWLLAQPPAKRPGVDAAAETARLRDLLFDPATGALARAAAGEAFDGMSRFDVAGVMDLHRAAVEVAAAAADGPRVAAALQATLAVARALAGHPVGQTQAGDIHEVLTDVAAAGRPAVPPAGWAAFLADLDAYGKAAAAKKMWWAGASVRMAEFRAAEDPAAAEAWYAEAAAWPRMPPAMKIDIHARLLDLAAARGAAADASLQALAGESGPKAAAARAFFTGLADERAGRLDKAFNQFAQAANADPRGEYGRRGLSAVPGLALVLGKPLDAANWAKSLDEGWKDVAKLDPAGRAWVAAHVGGQDEVVALIVVGQGRAHRQRLERKEKGKPDTGAAVKWAETATALLRRLDPKGGPALAARLARAEVLSAAGQTAEAKAALDGVRTDFPAATAAALRAELPAADVAGRTAADARAKAVGNLFWAEWLASTGRAPEGAGELDRAGATALAGLVKGMDGAAAAALIRAVAAADDPTALTADRAVGRRAKAAVGLYGAGKMDEAGRAFAALAEVADLKAAAAAAGKRAADAPRG